MVKSMAVDKLDFMVFEKNPELYSRIREAIIAYAVQSNVETDIYWLKEESQLTDLRTISKKVHIAFVNSDYKQASLLAGQTIFKEDEDVLIAFYGSNTVDMKSLFASRPITYMESTKDSFENTIKGLHALICERKRVFIWTNKNVRLFIPHNRIIYMQSYKGYVDIVTSDNGKYHILGKLDAVEEKLQDENFIRVHKSAIVNIRLIRSMDRTNKYFTMSNNDKVYISKAYYKEVSSRFENVRTKSWEGT